MNIPLCTNNNAMHWVETGRGPEICPLFIIMSGFDMHISLSWRSISLNKRRVVGSSRRHIAVVWMLILGGMIKDLILELP